MAEYITIMLVNNKSAGEYPPFHPATSDISRAVSCMLHGELTVGLSTAQTIQLTHFARTNIV